MGLVLFTWSSPQVWSYISSPRSQKLMRCQSRTTAIITSVFTCLSSFGLVAVSLWFASERWAYSRHRGQRWLADVITEVSDKLRKDVGIDWLGRAHSTHVAPAAGAAVRYVRRL